MSKKDDDRPAEPAETKLDRRDFLKIVGVAGAAAAVPTAGAVAQQAPVAAPPTGPVAPASAPAAAAAKKTWMFLNSSEASFIEAAVDTLIPADAVGPGALDAGVAVYIDRQLAGAYGKGDRLYLEGPFASDATPQQGYQLPFTPSELIRMGIADTDNYAMATKKDFFSNLSAADRASVISDLDTGKAKLATIPTATFFNLLLQLTMEGYFADPMYGGNKDKAVWKMIGFPGAGVIFTDKIAAFRNKPYTEAPQSIADIS